MRRIKHTLLIALLVCALVAFAQPAALFAEGEQRVMVEYVPGRGPAVRAALERAGGQVHHEFGDLNVIAVTLPAAAVQGLQRNPNVVLVAEDTPRYPMAEPIELIPWGVYRVQAPKVWDASTTGNEITVCVIDSGLYTAHDDLVDAEVIGGYPTGWNTDLCGHGTHVAGTIAATLDNGLGVAGVSPAVSLYIVKVFGDNCSWTYSSDLIDATNRCKSGGADIISMSLGGGKPIGPWEQRQFDSLYNGQILSIAAAGNAGNTQYSYPASHKSVISVAATDVNNVVADFSQKNDQVELAAPGVDVLSTVPWVADTSLAVDGVTYAANHIENAAYGTANGNLANGGRCTTTGSWTGKVVLCERGDVSFYDKVRNVQNSGGVAAVIYNNEPGNFLGTLGDSSSTILAISTSQEDGQYLVANKLTQSGTVASAITKPGSGYEAWSGTSMATPHVSGVAALLWSYSRDLTNAQIRDVMNNTALDLGATGRDNAYGYGLVQACAALSGLGGSCVGGTDPVNQPPTASFTFSCTSLECAFDASGSADPDGSIVSYAWTFGDGSTGSDVTASHTYHTSGTYTVDLTVTDDGGADDTSSQNVTVTAASAGDITLSATGYKVRGRQQVDLAWTGTTSTQVDVYRDGTTIAMVANSGAYTDNINKVGGGSYTYQVCEAGTKTCSNTVTVTF